MISDVLIVVIHVGAGRWWMGAQEGRLWLHASAICCFWRSSLALARRLYSMTSFLAALRGSSPAPSRSARTFDLDGHLSSHASTDGRKGSSAAQDGVWGARVRRG
jgi:hypothetical protein